MGISSYDKRRLVSSEPVSETALDKLCSSADRGVMGFRPQHHGRVVRDGFDVGLVLQTDNAIDRGVLRGSVDDESAVSF